MHLALRFVLLSVLLIVSPTAHAQEGTALVPYTSATQGFSSVVPRDWTEVGPGIFTRQRTATDPTVLVQQAVPAPPADVLMSLLPDLNLTEPPPSTGTHRGGALEWTLYHAEPPAGAGHPATDLGLAVTEAMTYVVVLQTTPDEAVALHADVFLPVLDAFAPLAVVATPISYPSEDVTFANGDITLAGTLTLPPGAGPHPAIVLVSGSGAQDRNEDIGAPLRPFQVLADELTRAGVAVLRYDDRGTGQSTGTFAGATTHDFATDAEAAITYLLTREEVDPDRLGLLGHSEGGYVAAMLGARNDDLAFIVFLAGPGVSGRELVLRQAQRVQAANGASPAEIAAEVAFLEELMTLLDDPAAVEALARERAIVRAEALPDEERASLGDLDAYARERAQRIVREYTTGWFAALLAYDPAADLARITVPVLAIYGGKDVQVDAEQNAPAMAAGLAAGGNEAAEIVVLPEANHLFQRADTGSPAEYVTLPAEFTPELIPTLVEWLTEQEIIAP